MEAYIQYLSENEEKLTKEQRAQIPLKLEEMEELQEKIKKSSNSQSSQEIITVSGYQDELDTLNSLIIMKEIERKILLFKIFFN